MPNFTWLLLINSPSKNHHVSHQNYLLYFLPKIIYILRFVYLNVTIKKKKKRDKILRFPFSPAPYSLCHVSNDE